MEQKRALVPKVPVSIPEKYKDKKIYTEINSDKWLKNPQNIRNDSEKTMDTTGGIYHGYPRDSYPGGPDTISTPLPPPPDTKTLIMVTVACLTIFYFLSKYTDV